MTKIITIANQKGGVGKTTTALCLGAELQEKGFKVLYIDLDKQCNTSETLRADTDKKGSYEILTNKEDAKELIQITQTGDAVICGSEMLDVVENILNSNKNSVGKEYRLKKSLESVKGLFDFVIIDTPPRLDSTTINALTTTDYLIIVSGADTYSVKGIKDLYTTINNVREYTNANLFVGGFLITRFNQRGNIKQAYKEQLEQLASNYNTKVYKTFIRENIAIKESQALGQHITTYAPKSNANEDYLNFTNEVLEDLNNIEKGA